MAEGLLLTQTNLLDLVMVAQSAHQLLKIERWQGLSKKGGLVERSRMVR
jgi:hypothetical protein